MVSRFGLISPYQEKEICRYLLKDEPWHLIALDALFTYGINQHPEHRWYGEWLEGRLIGLVYQHNNILQICYEQMPVAISPVFQLLSRHKSSIIYGKKDNISRVIDKHPELRLTLHEEAEFLLQSEETIKKIMAYSGTTQWQIRYANSYDQQQLHHLLGQDDVQALIDNKLVEKLLHTKRLLIALEDRRVVGAVMRLKESKHFSLIGNLYVPKEVRRQGIALQLGKQLILDLYAQGKKACFFFSDQALSSFYAKAGCQSIGKWGSYALTSKRYT
jgi:N-acetylglutamate synthase-like GNAT family acetyltransferase